MPWVISDRHARLIISTEQARQGLGPAWLKDIMEGWTEVVETTVEEAYDIDSNPFDKKCWVEKGKEVNEI